MALNIPVLGTVRWYFPTDPAIDYDQWENPTGLGHEYVAPPIKEGETAAYLELQQLSNGAYARAKSIQAGSDDALPPEMEEHVLRHGIVGWSGLYHGDDPLPAPQFEDGPYGRRLTKEAYEVILPFLSEYAPLVATHIYLLTLPQRS